MRGRSSGGMDSGVGVGVVVLSSVCFCFFLASVSLRLLTAWRIDPLAQRAILPQNSELARLFGLRKEKR